LNLDWREAIDESDSECDDDGRHAVKPKAQRFYEYLKENADEGYDACGMSETTFTIEEFKFESNGGLPNPRSKNDRKQRLEDICQSIEFNKRKKMELYAVMGQELANMKYSYVKNKCEKCNQGASIYEVINHATCTKRNNIEKFFDKATSITGYTKDYINYFIHISNMCELYPKLLYASVSVDEMKRHRSYVEECMKEEADFWKVAS